MTTLYFEAADEDDLRKCGFDKPIVVADAGLLSKRNIAGLKSDGYGFILGARPKNDCETVKEAILSLNLKDGEVRVIDRGDGMRMVVFKTGRRTAKDRKTRERGLSRLEKRLGSGRLTKANTNDKGYNKYLAHRAGVPHEQD